MKNKIGPYVLYLDPVAYGKITTLHKNQRRKTKSRIDIAHDMIVRGMKQSLDEASKGVSLKLPAGQHLILCNMWFTGDVLQRLRVEAFDNKLTRCEVARYYLHSAIDSNKM